jgi:ZIP family zinc transporter
MVAAPVSYAVLAAIGLAAGAATLLGGALALKFARQVHLVLGFSAGAVIGVALLDLLPEALALGRGGVGDAGVTTLAAAGFLAYLVADRALLMLAGGSAQHRGHFGAGALTVHSLLDGLGIGLGLQASLAVGLALAVAVLAHDLADGVNTVNVSLTASKNPRTARRWLAADAAAPMVGIAASRLIVLPPGALGLVLAVFAGFFLYIGASELLPESHHRHPRAWTTVSTVLGVALIWAVVRLAGAQ